MILVVVVKRRHSANLRLPEFKLDYVMMEKKNKKNKMIMKGLLYLTWAKKKTNKRTNKDTLSLCAAIVL